MLCPSRRCSARKASASAQVASHSGVDTERANSITTARVCRMCPSLRPAADIASAYWSTISCWAQLLLPTSPTTDYFRPGRESFLSGPEE